MNNDALYAHVNVFFNHDWGKLVVGRQQSSLADIQNFAGYFTLGVGHYDMTIPGFYGAVHDQQITVKDTHAFHAAAGYATIEGSGLMLNQVLVQIQPFVHIIISGTGESSGYPGQIERHPERCAGVMSSKILQHGY